MWFLPMMCKATGWPWACLFDIKWRSLEGSNVFNSWQKPCREVCHFLGILVFCCIVETMSHHRGQASGTASVNSSSLATPRAKQIRKQWHTREQWINRQVSKAKTHQTVWINRYASQSGVVASAHFGSRSCNGGRRFRSTSVKCDGDDSWLACCGCLLLDKGQAFLLCH